LTKSFLKATPTLASDSQSDESEECDGRSLSDSESD